MSDLGVEVSKFSGVEIVSAGGEGPNIIFLHPAGQPPLGMREHVQQLAEVGRVIAPNIFDLIAVLQRRGIKNPSFADIVNEFMGLYILDKRQKTGLVAVSFGGSFAWRYAAEKPKEVDWVVAGSPTGWPLRRSLGGWMIEFIKMMHNFSQAPAELRRKDPGPGLFVKQAIMNPRAVFWGLVMAAQANDRKILPDVTAPVDLLWGLRDTFIPVESGRQMQSLLPNSTFTIVSPHGHLWPNLEPDKLTAPAMAHLGLSK